MDYSDNSRYLARRSYFVPDGTRPVKNNRQLRSYEKRYWEYRYKLMKYRGQKLVSIGHQWYNLMREIDDFVKKNDYLEHQIHQYKDLCSINNIDAEQSDCPDEYDWEEQLESEFDEWDEKYTKQKNRFPSFPVGATDLQRANYRWTEQNYYHAKYALEEYRKYALSDWLPIEERRNKNMFAGTLFDWWKEDKRQSNIHYKHLMPHNMDWTSRANLQQSHLPQGHHTDGVYVNVPFIEPSLREMDRDNSKWLQRNKELDTYARTD